MNRVDSNVMQHCAHVAIVGHIIRILFMKVIGNDVNTNVLRQMRLFYYSHRKVFTFRSWLYLRGVVLTFLISMLKVFKSLQSF